MKRTVILYLLVIITIGSGIFGILHLGNELPPPAAVPGVAAAAIPRADSSANHSFFASVIAGLQQSAGDPLTRLFVQLLVIIAASRLAGWIFTRIGQPAVVGEMLAGILLGPSLFGLLAHGAFQFVFPAASMGALQLFSQIGVCLFMFAVGMELDLSHMRNRAHTVVFVSHASIIIPYFFGVALALFYTAASRSRGLHSPLLRSSWGFP